MYYNSTCLDIKRGNGKLSTSLLLFVSNVLLLKTIYEFLRGAYDTLTIVDMLLFEAQSTSYYGMVDTYITSNILPTGIVLLSLKAFNICC